MVTSTPLFYVQIIKSSQFIPSVSFHPYFQFILICVGPVAENCPPPVGGWEAPSPICSEFSSSGWETAGGRSPIDNQDQFRSIKELWRRQKKDEDLIKLWRGGACALYGHWVCGQFYASRGKKLNSDSCLRNLHILSFDEFNCLQDLSTFLLTKNSRVFSRSW